MMTNFMSILIIACMSQYLKLGIHDWVTEKEFTLTSKTTKNRWNKCGDPRTKEQIAKEGPGMQEQKNQTLIVLPSTML